MLDRVMRWRLAACVVIAWLATVSTATAVPLFATNEATGSISPFSIQPNGTLSPIACTPASNCQTEPGTFVYGIAANPLGSALYTASDASGNTGSASAFAIGPGSLLSPITCTPMSNCQTGANTSPYAIAVDPSGRYVYTADDNNPGSVSGFAIGAAGALSPIACTPASNCETGFYPLGIAIDPGGRYLYTANENSNSISAFSIGSGGALTPVVCGGCTVPVSSGNSLFGMAVDPAGRYVYVTNFTRGKATEPGSVEVFSIGTGGALSPVTCTTNCQTGNGSYPEAVAVDPTGRYLYTADDGDDSVSAFSIGSDGTLTPIVCSPASNCQTLAGTTPQALAIDPTGRFLYVTGSGGSTISVFSIGSDGTLTPIACSPSSNCQMAAGSRGIVVAPDRGPTASLHVSVAPPGSPTTLDASASSSPDYPIASYAWSFGDGQSAVTSSPSVQHRYATAGVYTVTVTVTDQAGCSTSEVYDGQSAYCDGSSKASATSTISVVVFSPPPLCRCSVRIAPRVTQARESNSRWRAGAKLAVISRKRKPPVGTVFSFTLNEQATVSFSFSRSVSGRKVAHKCVAKSRKNARHKSCKRTIAAGTLRFAGHQGVDRVVFDGRVSRTRKLTPGTYTLAIIATNAAGLRSAPAKLTFTIVK
jgi:DNA-binding beta-propeller fold protein YncE